MARLLDDLLDVTRVSRGTLVLARRRLALSSVFDAAIEVATPAIEARRHQLQVTLPDAPIEIDGDAVRLSQVLSNLLNNAAKYTDAGGTIELSARRIDQTVRIAVKDSGIGLAPESLAGVFDMFSQVQSALDRSEGGLGIGLTLVRALVELHGGRVDVESKGLGQGSTFSVVLPLAVGTAEASGAAAGGAAADEAIVGRRRVLIADDNVDAAESLAELVQLAGHDVRVVHDGTFAVDMAREFRPHVAFLDLGMPGCNGYEVARRIRLEPWSRGVRLVAVTGWGREDDRSRSRDAGFDSHLTKPVNPSAVEAALSAAEVLS